ncbi:MAG: hypothetical protein GXP02_05195, partial [Alphaproteobacteria bacterium]|nr:hypothetical protein [Alphaproteobacteria bacterium]
MTDDCNIPPLTSLVPEDIAPYKNNMVLIDLRDPDQEPTLQVVGQLLIQDMDPGSILKDISDIPRHTLLSRITDHYREVVASHSPVSFEAEFKNISGNMILYRCILLPFSDDGDNVNFILGALRWITEQHRNDPQPDEREQAAGATASGLQHRLEACRQLLRGEDSAKMRSRKSLYRALGAILDFHILCCASPESYHELLAAAGVKTQQRAPFTPT